VALLIAFAVAIVATPLAARVAIRLGVVDHPGPLKVHAAAVPYLGGVAVFVAVACGVATQRPVVLVPLSLALLLGLADDVFDVSARIRLLAEVAVGAAAVSVVLVRGPLGAVVTVAFVVVLCNAVNLLDGLDGLAAGVVAAGAVGFAVAFDGSWSALALAVVGALAGFLVWNRPPARIYLGDAGSYLLGATLALLLARAWSPGAPIALGAGSLLFVAVPVADTAIAIVRRARSRRPLFLGDRGHVYDQLVDRGWPAPRVTLTCVMAQLTLTAAGVAITEVASAAAVVAAAVVVVAVALLALCTFARAV